MSGTSEAALEPEEDRFEGPWLIGDQAYLSFVGRLFAAAEWRCLVSLVFVDAPSPVLIEGLLRELARASARGVDARLLVSTARSDAPMIDAAEATRRHATVLGVPSRWVSRIPTVAGHSRIAISDDNVVFGSHDWSAPHAAGQPDNVFVVSPSLARTLDRRFRQRWHQPGAGPP